ncbi:MAG: SCO family protein [Planctomycetota bacterium]|nr:SCO family protein [Planctomycetota bacterium]
MKHNVPETAAPPFQRLLLMGFLGLAITLALMLALRPKSPGTGSGTRSVLAAESDSAESFATVKPFRLTERSGAEVSLDTLKGRPWVASFIFTRCSGPCPRVSGSMKKVQALLAGTDVRLVTFSVDPLHDTPEILREYALRFEADPERWLFLTGTLEAMRDVSFQSFQLPFERDEAQPVGQLVTHKTLLTVIDREGVIRGYYDGESDEGVAQAAARAQFLSRAP